MVFEEQQLSYRELNNRANQLAHYLRKLGVGPEILVGICIDRSLEMIVALLGILKAGGAYLPLDPQYPKERLAFLLADSQVSVLLTQEKCLQASNIEGSFVLIGIGRKLLMKARRALRSKTQRKILAYVIYTSGSTGKPKGVSITHGNVARLFQSTRAWFNFDVDRCSGRYFTPMLSISRFGRYGVRSLLAGG